MSLLLDLKSLIMDVAIQLSTQMMNIKGCTTKTPQYHFISPGHPGNAKKKNIEGGKTIYFQKNLISDKMGTKTNQQGRKDRG